MVNTNIASNLTKINFYAQRHFDHVWRISQKTYSREKQTTYVDAAIQCRSSQNTAIKMRYKNTALIILQVNLQHKKIHFQKKITFYCVQIE